MMNQNVTSTFNLYSKDIRSSGQADDLFGTEKGLLVCRPGRWVMPWFCVPDGCYALVTKFGKDEDYAPNKPVWPAGFHFGPPWKKVSNLVTKQSVVFNMPVKGCKTQDNVTVQINLSIVFRIMGDESKGEDPYLVRNFVYKARFDGRSARRARRVATPRGDSRPRARPRR